jgi:hypothetical protein
VGVSGCKLNADVVARDAAGYPSARFVAYRRE